MSNSKNLIEFFSEYKEIRIPRIQRAYAQGRKNEYFIRNSFLDDLFKTLKENDFLELNYVYGNVVKDEQDNPILFEILDGQQRITTLFLLHWYIACRENKLDDMVETLSKFRYETRHTSSDFCEALSKYHYIPIDEELPSQTIHKQFKWYFKSFDLDSTIDSMLRMIDAIHEHYNECDGMELFAALNNIQFYVLKLDDFGLSEELYIKMNARGLPLTPFENFKADFINYLKSSGEYDELIQVGEHQAPLYLIIASELDGKWVDIFWDDDDYLNIDKTEYDEENEDYSVKYFRFFFRYFASSFILKYRTDIQSGPMRQEQEYLFFHQISEEQKLSNYFRFDKYKAMLDTLGKSFVISMEKVLNTLYEHYQGDIKPLLTPPWGDTDNWDFFSAVKPSGFTLQRRIVFAAICEFIEAYKDFDTETFRRWMRVVWNVVNNTDIDSISPATYLERNLSSIIRGAAESGEELYSYLSNYSSKGDDDDNGGERSKSISEEIIKARYIVNYSSWLSLFETAEKHPFCKGMVRFFLRDEEDTPDKFSHRFAFVEQMFNADGVTPAFSQDGDYILLRAMISCINSWKSIGNRYFTDKVERKYNALRVILTTPANACIREFLCDTLEADTLQDVTTRLKQATQRSSNLDVSKESDIWKKREVAIHEHLYKDAKYMRWMQLHGAIRVFGRYGYYYAVEYGSSLNLLLIESDRENYVNRLIKEEGFTLLNYQNSSLGKTKEEEYQEYGVYFGYYIHLLKKINGWNIHVVFSTNCELNVSIECPESEKQVLAEIYGSEVVDRVIEYSEPLRRFIKMGINYFPDDSYDTIHQELFGENGVLTKLPVRECNDMAIENIND